MSLRRSLGWAGFVAAVLWLYLDYQAKADSSKIGRAIALGWLTVALAGGHILAAKTGA